MASQPVIALHPSRQSAGAQEPSGGQSGSQNCRTGGPAAGPLKGQASPGTERESHWPVSKTTTRRLGPRFQGPVSPRQARAGLWLPAHEALPGTHWDASRRHCSAQLWGKSGRAGTECQSSRGSGGRSPRRAGRPGPPTALQLQGPPSQRTTGCGQAPPRIHRTKQVSDGRSDSGFGGRAWRGQTRGRAGVFGVEGGGEAGRDRRSPSLASSSPSPSPQHVGRRRLNVHSERWRHVSQLRAVGPQSCSSGGRDSEDPARGLEPQVHWPPGGHPASDSASLGTALLNNKM